MHAWHATNIFQMYTLIHKAYGDIFQMHMCTVTCKSCYIVLLLFISRIKSRTSKWIEVVTKRALVLNIFDIVITPYEHLAELFVLTVDELILWHLVSCKFKGIWTGGKSSVVPLYKTRLLLIGDHLTRQSCSHLCFTLTLHQFSI